MFDSWWCVETTSNFLRVSSTTAQQIQKALDTDRKCVLVEDVTGASVVVVLAHVVLIYNSTPETRAREAQLDQLVADEGEPWRDSSPTRVRAGSPRPTA